LHSIHRGLMALYEGTHQYNTDQIFLGRHVWTSYQYDCLEHGYRQHAWMSDSRTDTDHMGRGYTVAETPRMDHGG
jgi:hypothetical protein